MTVVNPWVDLIADTILDNVVDAAASSHSPDNVRFWLDANSRYLLAARIADAVGFPSGAGETDLDDIDMIVHENMTNADFVEALHARRANRQAAAPQAGVS